MDFLLGLSSIIPTALYNKSIIKLTPKINPALTLGIVMLMAFGTGAIMIFWGFGLYESVENTKTFMLGMCGAVVMNMIGKIIYMLQNPID